MNLRTVKACLFEEGFDHLCTCNSLIRANKSIDEWTKYVMEHRTFPELKKFAKMIRSHQALVLNYFRAKKRVLFGGSREFQQQSKTGHQKILRLLER